MTLVNADTGEIIVRSRIHVEANSQARRYYYLKLKKRNAR